VEGFEDWEGSFEEEGSRSSPLFEDASAISLVSLGSGTAATFPQVTHAMQCECHLWYVPSLTQSSSTVVPHFAHKSDGGLLEEMTVPFPSPLLCAPGENGLSPAFSGARLLKPYVTHCVP
jgi:hypothetical protein